jgi:hypothetical protein
MYTLKHTSLALTSLQSIIIYLSWIDGSWLRLS